MDGFAAARFRRWCFTSELLEKLLEECLTLQFKEPAQHFNPMVQPALGGNVEDRPAGAGLGVPGAEDEPRDAGLYDGAGTHGTGLQGHVERGVSQTPGSQLLCRFPDDNHLRMGRRVL